jgi:hypothetical protein
MDADGFQAPDIVLVDRSARGFLVRQRVVARARAMD